jgi:hypothetical protein
MSYLTLDEAADWLTRRLATQSKIEVTPFTGAQILKIGIHGRLPLVVALSTVCYSPTLASRNMREGLQRNAKEWARTSPQETMDAATTHAIGFFIVPVVHLFEFEVRDVVRLKQVTSLDGADVYNPHEDIDRARLRVLVRHLEIFSTGAEIISIHEDISAPTAPVGYAQRSLTSEQEAEVVRLYNRGHGTSMSMLGPQFGVSRTTIDNVLKRAGVKK